MRTQTVFSNYRLLNLKYLERSLCTFLCLIQAHCKHPGNRIFFFLSPEKKVEQQIKKPYVWQPLLSTVFLLGLP